MSGERFKLILEAAPDRVPIDHRLKRLLKAALRSFGFRCKHIAKLEEGEEATR